MVYQMLFLALWPTSLSFEWFEIVLSLVLKCVRVVPSLSIYQNLNYLVLTPIFELEITLSLFCQLGQTRYAFQISYHAATLTSWMTYFLYHCLNHVVYQTSKIQNSWPILSYSKQITCHFFLQIDLSLHFL
jgi:hypothetical protein